MSRVIARTAAALAVVIACAGCASVAKVRTGAGDPAPTGSPGSSGPPASSTPPDTATGAPAVSTPPTGPAATAARDTPPPVGKEAVARVGSATVGCPVDPSYVAGHSPGRTPLPPEVAIKAVVRCETVLRAYPGLGEWSVQLAEVANTAAAPLLTELRKPSEPTPPNIVCASYLAVMPWFALVDDRGQVLQPALPTDKCGQYLPSVGAALSKLDFRAVDAVRIAQSRAPESIRTGCDQRWKDVVALEGARHPDGTGSGSIGDLASSPSSVLVCLYRAGPLENGLRVGDLIKGVTVTGPIAGSIGGTAGIVDPLPSGCVDAAEFAVIGSGAYVELGGCGRLVTSDGRFGSATEKLLEQVKTALGLS